MQARFSMLCVCGLALALIAAAAWGQMGREEVRQKARGIMAMYEIKEYVVRDVMLAPLIPDEPYYFETHLSAGNEYFFHAEGNEHVKNLSIEVYDEEYELLKRADTNKTMAAVVSLTPQWSGAAHVKISGTETSKGLPYWFALIGYK